MTKNNDLNKNFIKICLLSFKIKERKRMATEIAEKEETIKKLERQNRRLSDLNGEISSRVFSANKPSPSENFEDRPRADRRARRAVSEDRHTGRQSHSSSSRNRSKFSH